MKKYFGFIENNRAYFHFDQVQLKNGSFGIMFTNNPDSEKGIIDTGFTGSLIFPKKYKAIGWNIEKTDPLKLANNDKLLCTQAKTQISFLGEKFQEETILFAEVNQPIIGMDFLNSFEEVAFNFDDDRVYY